MRPDNMRLDNAPGSENATRLVRVAPIDITL